MQRWRREGPGLLWGAVRAVAGVGWGASCWSCAERRLGQQRGGQQVCGWSRDGVGEGPQAGRGRGEEGWGDHTQVDAGTVEVAFALQSLHPASPVPVSPWGPPSGRLWLSRPQRSPGHACHPRWPGPALWRLFVPLVHCIILLPTHPILSYLLLLKIF